MLTSAIQRFLTEKIARERYRATETQTSAVILPRGRRRPDQGSDPFDPGLVPTVIHSITRDRNEAVVSFGETKVQLDKLIERCLLTVCAFYTTQQDAGK
jgi:hypothetical protein